MSLEQQLQQSERVNEIFLNRHNESRTVNRIKKLRSIPYKYIYHQAYKILGLRSDVVARVFWGTPFVVPLWDENGAIIYFSGAFGHNESGITRYLIENLAPGDVFYDVGANMGYYTSLGEYLGAAVHAFEPNPSIIKYTRKNAPHSHINEVAVSNVDGEAEFFDITRSNKSGMSSLFGDIIPRLNKKTQVVRTVQTITLDSYMEKNPLPSMMKIDVENAEGLVLQGAKQFLATHSPTIIMEVDVRPESKARTDVALNILSDLGYTSYGILRDGSLQVKSTDLSKPVDNFCFKKS